MEQGAKVPRIRLGFHGAGPVVILNVGESRNQHDQAADDEHQLHVDKRQLKPERIGKRPGEHGPEKAQSLKQGHICPVRSGLVAGGNQFLRGDVHAGHGDDEQKHSDRAAGGNLIVEARRKHRSQNEETGHAEPRPRAAAPQAEAV